MSPLQRVLNWAAIALTRVNIAHFLSFDNAQRSSITGESRFKLKVGNIIAGTQVISAEPTALDPQ